MAITTAEKVRENLVRRMAKRQGLELCKSRRRDPLALEYGRFRLTDVQRGVVVFGGNGRFDGYRATLDEVETWLRAARNEDRVMVSAT